MPILTGDSGANTNRSWVFSIVHDALQNWARGFVHRLLVPKNRRWYHAFAPAALEPVVALPLLPGLFLRRVPTESTSACLARQRRRLEVQRLRAWGCP